MSDALSAGRDACLAQQFGGADTYSTTYNYTFGANGEQTGCTPIAKMGASQVVENNADKTLDSTFENNGGMV